MLFLPLPLLKRIGALQMSLAQRVRNSDDSENLFRRHVHAVPSAALDRSLHPEPAHVSARCREADGSGYRIVLSKCPAQHRRAIRCHRS